MAKIIYKDGCEGQNRLECIEGIEIELLNGQKALVYPKYAVREMLPEDKIKSYDAEPVTEIEALKKTDSNWATGALLKLGSPAAEFVSKFHSARFGLFALPTLLAAMEIQDQKKDIDELAETVEGADLLRNFTSIVWSCSRCTSATVGLRMAAAALLAATSCAARTFAFPSCFIDNLSLNLRQERVPAPCP